MLELIKNRDRDEFPSCLSPYLFLFDFRRRGFRMGSTASIFMVED